MAQCALETAREMGWAKDALLPLASPPSPLASATPSADPETMSQVLNKGPGWLSKLASSLSDEEIAELVALKGTSSAATDECDLEGCDADEASLKGKVVGTDVTANKA